MGSGDLEVDYNNAAYTLTLTVNLLNSGGVTGLAPTVAIRLAPTTNEYWDWATNTFKTSGWTVQFEPMTDLGTGRYQAVLNVAAMGFTPASGLPQTLIAEYSFPNTGQGAGIATDEITVSELRPATTRTRQYATNRLEVLAPGTETLYADDGVTPLTTQTLTDAGNGPIANEPGSPQKRGAAH